MNTSETIRSRRSIRKYKKDAVIPQEHIEQILEAAMMAPSACNKRPWEFVVVENKELLQQLSSIQPHSTYPFQTASIGIVACGRPDLQANVCEGFWPLDCGAAIQNMLLQAKELGYGTCWCGLYPIEKWVVKFQELLDVTSIPCGFIALGVPKEDPEARGYFDPERVKYIR